MKSHETINAKVEKEIYINKQQNVDKNEKKNKKKMFSNEESLNRKSEIS